jgi:hypothetical protein
MPLAGKPVGIPPIARIPIPVRAFAPGVVKAGGTDRVTGALVVVPEAGPAPVAAFAAAGIVVVAAAGVTAGSVVVALAPVVGVVPAPTPPPTNKRPPAPTGALVPAPGSGTFANIP